MELASLIAGLGGSQLPGAVGRICKLFQCVAERHFVIYLFFSKSRGIDLLGIASYLSQVPNSLHCFFLEIPICVA